ncbi:MAG: radical SAM protein [Planctomycetes bacterium]|nr:radical SAM protein [Planctomycetota bacterium]
MSDKEQSANISIHARHQRLTEELYGSTDRLPARYCFVLTTRCNLRCPFCPQPEHGAELKELSGAQWINLAQQLPDYCRVTITGGEPFLHRDFEEIFDHVANRFDCNIISNGLLLNDERISRLLSAPKFMVLSISIDDIGNRVRGFSEDKWDRLLQRLKAFREARDRLNPEVVLDIKSVVLDDNADELFDLHRYVVEELHADSHAFQFLKGSAAQHGDHMFGFEELESHQPLNYERFDVIQEQLERVRAYSVQHGSRVFLHPKVVSLQQAEQLPDLSSLLNIDRHEPSLFRPCPFPWSSVHLHPDGTLYPCLSVAMGNVADTPLADIINGREMRRFRDMIMARGSLPSCHRCGWLMPPSAK